jgi:hypothetical protein
MGGTTPRYNILISDILVVCRSITPFGDLPLGP